MYTTVCLDIHARVLLTKSTGMCQQRVNAGWDISRLSLVRFSRGIWIFPLLQEYSLKSPKPCQPMTCTPRGHWALTLRGINEKATSRVPEEIPVVLHQITAPRDGKKRRLSQRTYLKTICCLKSSLLTYLKKANRKGSGTNLINNIMSQMWSLCVLMGLTQNQCTSCTETCINGKWSRLI